MMMNSILTLILPMIIMKLSMMMSKKMKLDNEKMSPFECGFNLISSARMPFSLRFFFISIIFLIFDIEIAIIMPFIPTYMLSNHIIWLITMISMLIILLIGTYYEWLKGALNWL